MPQRWPEGWMRWRKHNAHVLLGRLTSTKLIWVLAKTQVGQAKSVSTKDSRSRAQENEESTYLKGSDVQRMSPKEYEKRSDEIMEAIRTGKFIYDMSGSAR